MGRVMLVLVALLMVGLWVNSVVSDRPTRSQARASTPTVTRVSTPTPAPETTATAVATPLASATPSGPETIHETYIVQPGDTLNRIAARFSQEAGHNVTVAAIVAANGIPNPARIGVGQQFTIPVVVSDGAAAPTAVPTRRPTPFPTARVDTGNLRVSTSVAEGCIGVAILKGALEEGNLDVLETFGVGAARAMVSTDDEVLNMVGGIVALHMVDYGKVPTTLGMQKILEGLDVYTETCENLMRE